MKVRIRGAGSAGSLPLPVAPASQPFLFEKVTGKFHAISFEVYLLHSLRCRANEVSVWAKFFACSNSPLCPTLTTGDYRASENVPSSLVGMRKASVSLALAAFGQGISLRNGIVAKRRPVGSRQRTPTTTVGKRGSGRKEMGDRIEGFLEVGIDENLQVCVNHPDLKPDENGVGHIIFSPSQARNLAYLMIRKANEAEEEGRRAFWKKKEEEVLPVDRSARVMTDGSPETPDHREIEPSTGMQKGYIVLSAEERAKGFVRPVRTTYTHATCGTTTTMGTALAETYARDPKFYSGTFCCHCRAHYPLNEFVWTGTDEQVGA